MICETFYLLKRASRLSELNIKTVLNNLKMTENNHYYTPEQELAMELKIQEMVSIINSGIDRKEQEIMLDKVEKIILGVKKCQHCFNKVKNRIK